MRFVVNDWLEDTVLPWPDEDGPWEVALHWAAGELGVMCSGFDLRTAVGAAPEEITASRLRELRLHELVQEGRRRKYEAAGGEVVEAHDAAGGEEAEHEVGVPGAVVEALREEVGAWSPPARGRRLEHEHYERVAIVYSAALAAGRRPLQAVMHEAEWSPTTKPTASRWVARARELGYLPTTGRGRARGNARLIGTEDVSL